MKHSITLLSLVLSTTASPLLGKRADVLDSAKTFCQGWDLATPQGVDDLWEKTGAGASLDLFLTSQWEHQHNWTKNLEDLIEGGTDGTSSVAGCYRTSNDCNPTNSLTCTDYYNKYGLGPLQKNSYWIFQAIKGAHDKFSAFKDQLTQQTLITDLGIGQMVNEFQGKDQINDADMLGWLSAATGMGSAIGGLVPGVGEGISMGFDILGGVFDMMADNLPDESIDTSTIESGLGSIFNASTTGIDRILNIATGGGDTDADYASLPAPKWDTYKYNVAKFFNGGWFLLNDDSKAVRSVIDTIGNNLKAKVANQVMKAAGLVLMVDATDGVRTRESCGYATGRQWLKARDNEEYCFYVMRKKSSDYKAVDEGIYGSMAKYGLGNREMFYSNVIDCYLYGGDNDNIDTSDITWGKLPRCYFSLPMYKMVSRDAPKCSDNFDGGHCGENWKISEFK